MCVVGLVQLVDSQPTNVRWPCIVLRLHLTISYFYTIGFQTYSISTFLSNVYLHWCVLCHSELYTNSKSIAYCIVPINTKLCKVHLLQSAICSCHVLLRRNNYKKYRIRYKVQSSRIVLISILFEDKLKHSKQQWSWLVSCQNWSCAFDLW